ARLAAERRSHEQAASLLELANAVAGAPDDSSALLGDWAFMAALVEAAGNLVFQLIMNSVRELYLPHAEAFAALVADRETLGELYTRVARAIDERAGDARARALRRSGRRPPARLGRGSRRGARARAAPGRGQAVTDVLEADFCVIGAGAGGAVTAAELAEAGARVVVLEQGPSHDADEFSARPPEM